MKKEVFIAILLGLGLGLIVTYGTYTARKTLLSSGKSNVTATPTATPSSQTSALSLIAPEDESLVFTKENRVTGTTIPNSIVVILVHNKPLITRADESGNFSVQITLEPGANVIIVRAIDQEGNPTEEERTVIYSLTSLEETPPPTATPSARPRATTIPKASPKPTSSPTPR